MGLYNFAFFQGINDLRSYVLSKGTRGRRVRAAIGRWLFIDRRNKKTKVTKTYTIACVY